MTFSVAIAGASGYAGGELLRLLAGHAEFEVTTVTAHSNAGAMLTSVHPHLRDYAHLHLVETTSDNLAGHDIVFLALPHGASGAISAQLPADTLVVDCGADHRLDSKADWDAFYGGEYAGAWAYGIPELVVGGFDATKKTQPAKQRDALAGATRIAAPGCNASSVSLALAPGLASRVIRANGVTATLAVGPSGAGKAARVDLLASEIMGSANPYAVGNKHRHIP
jgi:N-acetyl-gamma-glutamyl-phosphate reductase